MKNFECKKVAAKESVNWEERLQMENDGNERTKIKTCTLSRCRSLAAYTGTAPGVGACAGVYTWAWSCRMGCHVSNESFLLPLNPPPLLFTLVPFIPMLQGKHEGVMVWCSAVTPAKRLPHQACGPQCLAVRFGALWGPHARWSREKKAAERKGTCWREERACLQHVHHFPELLLPPRRSFHSVRLTGWFLQCCHFCCGRLRE